MFEDLVEELLKQAYPSLTWIRTKKSHDGNRDFFSSNDGKSIWAECKNYEDCISLKVIAPTLVMAQIHNADTIMFFSFSPINSGTRIKLSLYAESTGKSVLIYDDGILDEMIILSMDALSERVRPSPEDIYNSEPRQQKIEFCINRDPVVGVADESRFMIPYEDVNEIDYLSLFEIVICIDLPDNTDYNKITISFPICTQNERYNFICKDIDNNTLEFSSRSQCLHKRIPIKVLHYDKYILLPNIHVKVANDNGTIIEDSTPSRQVKLEWNNEINLIGEDYRNTVDDFEKRILDKAWPAKPAGIPSPG